MKNNHKFWYATKIWTSSWLLTPLVIIIIGVTHTYFTSGDTLNEILFPTKGLLKLNIFVLSFMIYGTSFVLSIPFWLLF